MQGVQCVQGVPDVQISQDVQISRYPGCNRTAVECKWADMQAVQGVQISRYPRCNTGASCDKMEADAKCFPLTSALWQPSWEVQITNEDRGANSWYCDADYGKRPNPGTESRKIVPKVGNERSLQGLQTGRWPKLGSCGKNWIFWPKTKILCPKKKPLLNRHHVLATTGKSCSKKKVAFSQINISFFLGDFLG